MSKKEKGGRGDERKEGHTLARLLLTYGLHFPSSIPSLRVTGVTVFL